MSAWPPSAAGILLGASHGVVAPGRSALGGVIDGCARGRRKRTMKTAPAIAVLAAATSLLPPNVASALGPVDIEIGAKVGGGTTPSNITSGEANPLGFGIGSRVGASFLGFYGGVSIAYYFGGNETVSFGQSFAGSSHSLMYGFEAGYGIKLADILTVRTQVGIGNFTNMIDSGPVSQSYGSLYLEPGIVGLVSLPFGGLFAGVDANVLVLTSVTDASGNSETGTAFTIHGQVGYRF